MQALNLEEREHSSLKSYVSVQIAPAGKLIKSEIIIAHEFSYAYLDVHAPSAPRNAEELELELESQEQ